MKTDREIQLEEENKRLRAKLLWIHNLMTNETIQPREKVVLYQTEHEISHAKQDESGLSHVRVWKIADETGIGRKVVGKSLQLLADNGVLTRKTIHILDKDTGIPEKTIFLGMTDIAKNPKEIELPTNNHGGTRKAKPKIFCPDCGSLHMVDMTRRQCTACGGVISEKHKFLNEIEQQEGDKQEENALHTYRWFLEENGSIDYVEPLQEFIIDYPKNWDDAKKQKFSDYVYMHHPFFLKFLEEKTKEETNERM